MVEITFKKNRCEEFVQCFGICSAHMKILVERVKEVKSYEEILQSSS